MKKMKNNLKQFFSPPKIAAQNLWVKSRGKILIVLKIDIRKYYETERKIIRNDFFFRTEIAALTHKFSSVMLYRNKTVRYSARMHAIVACQMEFQLYPMDIQVCPIYIESCECFDLWRMSFVYH